ncbi:AAA family ATPase [Orrella sp. JC864]|uniref:AAA family ATPase n=1 Tax=Orrella sp. JC864 TaxID=3120298 RepID=UPI003FA7BC5F
MVKQVQASNQISRMKLRGYKSIAECDLELGRLNVLIGANGAGKSNFIGFFRLINRILAQQLQLAVGLAGGPDALLHFGRKHTELLQAELYFGNNGYRFSLRPTQDNRMLFEHEALWWELRGDWHPASGHFETHYLDRGDHGRIWEYVVPAMRSWRIYHFHDTSTSALVKQVHSIRDNVHLQDDARNLAAFLLRLRRHHEEHYWRIVKTIRLVAPFFGDFHLRPTPDNPERIQLEWTELGQEEPFGAAALSDGTLRFICLAAVLLQPEELMPASILIDEPELGLHPYAISILGGLMRSVAQERQLLVSTQSVELVNEFDPEDLIVVDKRDGASQFRRPDAGQLAGWLADYSLGELWKKNLLGGRPGR